MRTYVRGFGRALAVLGLAVLVQASSGTWLVEGVTGRAFPRCIQACNDSRKACDERCVTECRGLFPNNKAQRDACIAACKAICAVESDDCKLVCQNIKEPPSPEAP